VEVKEVLYVDDGDKKGNGAGNGGHYRQIAHDKKYVEPGYHEEKVDEARKKDEGTTDYRHFLSRMGVYEETQQEKQNKEGAWVEAVKACYDDGQNGKGKR